MPPAAELFTENAMKRLPFRPCLLFKQEHDLPPAHAEAQGQLVIPAGSRPSSTAPGQNFTGNVRVDPAFETQTLNVYGSHVCFEPGARTNWHTTRWAETLLVTFGVGLTQEWEVRVQVIRQGRGAVSANVKHWHGAAPDTMTHLAIGERLDGKSVTWMEQVAMSSITLTAYNIRIQRCT